VHRENSEPGDNNASEQAHSVMSTDRRDRHDHDSVEWGKHAAGVKVKIAVVISRLPAVPKFF
jgi:hypothetical protein